MQGAVGLNVTSDHCASRGGPQQLSELGFGRIVVGAPNFAVRLRLP